MSDKGLRSSTQNVACYTCHKRKVKCSGGQPCRACHAGNIECTYPLRDRKTRVSERYLRSLIKENQQLRAGKTPSAVRDESDEAPASAHMPPDASAAGHGDNRNPAMDERPWFVPLRQGLRTPVHIGEAADAAFATRVRQAISKTPQNHFPRVHYMDDEQLRALDNPPAPWPAPSYATFLINVALNTICRPFQIVRRSNIMNDLTLMNQDPASCNWLSSCRLFALLALGEAYASRSSLPGANFPGAHYFVRARGLLSMPCERPEIELVETYLLLSLYSFVLNRRHSACFLASSGLRLAITMGMHLTIAESQLEGAALREHRCRVWWTAYAFDRMWTSKVGQPASLEDVNIEARLPSSKDLTAEEVLDFGDPQYHTCMVSLARLASDGVNSLYGRQRHTTTFSHRVQTAVRELTDWSENLPKHLRMEANDGARDPSLNHILHMQLSFNQCVITATRPILLHLIHIQRQNAITSVHETKKDLPKSAVTLADACIRHARHSIRLLTASWTEGRFATLSYFNTQFLFSAATIMALSSMQREIDSAGDAESFILAAQFLKQLAHSGNYGANEFVLHFDAIQSVMGEMNSPAKTGMGIENHAAMMKSTSNPQMSSQWPELGSLMDLNAPGEPSLLQDFLCSDSIDLDFMDAPQLWAGFQDLSWIGPNELPIEPHANEIPP